MVLATQLGQLRDGVALLWGSEIAVSRSLAGLRPGDTLVGIDNHRYERWLVSMVNLAHDRGAKVVALTDSPLSPLAVNAMEAFFVSARGVGPFDSLVGGVALANLLVSAVAARLRGPAAARLDAIERAWTDSGAFVADNLTRSGRAALHGIPGEGPHPGGHAEPTDHARHHH
jgi:DNA-binding MurR/RpiR family transcriptional regulator